MAHGPGPRAPHGVGFDVALIEDPQGMDELPTEHRGTAFVVSQSEKRINHGKPP